MRYITRTEVGGRRERARERERYPDTSVRAEEKKPASIREENIIHIRQFEWAMELEALLLLFLKQH